MLAAHIFFSTLSVVPAVPLLSGVIWDDVSKKEMLPYLCQKLFSRVNLFCIFLPDLDSTMFVTQHLLLLFLSVPDCGRF